MLEGYEVVDEGHVGGQEQVPSEWKTIRAVFHNFASLSSKKGDMTYSPALECHGVEVENSIIPWRRSRRRGRIRISLFRKFVLFVDEKDQGAVQH